MFATHIVPFTVNVEVGTEVLVPTATFPPFALRIRGWMEPVPLCSVLTLAKPVPAPVSTDFPKWRHS